MHLIEVEMDKHALWGEKQTQGLKQKFRASRRPRIWGPNFPTLTAEVADGRRGLEIRGREWDEERPLKRENVSKERVVEREERADEARGLQLFH